MEEYDGAFESLSESAASVSSEVSLVMDFIDDLLVHGCWLETSSYINNNFNNSNNNHLLPFTNCIIPSSSSSSSFTTTSHYYPINNYLQHYCFWTSSDNSSSSSTTSSEIYHHQHHQQQQLESFVLENITTSNTNTNNDELLVGKRWWIGPKANPGPSSSVKERLVLAVGCLKELYYTTTTNNNNNNTANKNNFMIQIWVPPHHHEDYYRKLHHHNDYYGGGGVVRFFRSHEYPYANYLVNGSQQYYDNVRGGSCLALPMFERGSGTCLGVVEILLTHHHANHHNNNNINNINSNLSHNLQAVDFRSCQNFIPPPMKVFDEWYQAALNEIVDVLSTVCKTHNLPLALTWAPCVQQNKTGCPHNTNNNNNNNTSSSDDQIHQNNNNYMWCVSTVDSACYIGDLDLLGFQEACSEYHLFRGQGIVGTAFSTAKPCFATDITAFTKPEYPLSHHATMFGLHAAVAIPLRSSVYTGSSDFVLEFFLPKDCHDIEQQKQMLNSLSIVVQQACFRSLHVVSSQVVDNQEAEFMFNNNNVREILKGSSGIHKEETLDFGSQSSEEHPSSKESSWIAHMMEVQNQQKGKGVSVSLEYLEEPKQEFKVTTNWDISGSHHGGLCHNGQVFSSDFGQVHQQQQSSASRATVEGGGESYSYGGRRSSGGRKSGEKRRTKAEKTISLPVLRQYFAGSLKDAAKSIGVCPTTLKRICRQHGITRWPSRKIKKVGHSLRKLQLVIDSVQGAEGAIQIGSFYSSFPELSTTDLSSGVPHSSQSPSNNISDHSKKTHHHHHHQHHHTEITNGLLKSPPSCCSQTSTIINNNAINNNGDIIMTENPEALINSRVHTQNHALIEAELLEDAKHNHNHHHLEALPPLPAEITTHHGGAFRVKATFGDEKIRFSLQPNWGFRELQMEITRRFNLNNNINHDVMMNNFDLKYLDDDGEWVLLTCDADLEECKDIYRSSQSRTMRFSLFQASPMNLASDTFGNTSSSPS